MSYQIKFDEAQKQLLHLIEAAIQGEAVIIFNNDNQAVQLVPIKVPLRAPKFGSAKGLVEIANDFDEPLSDFFISKGVTPCPRKPPAKPTPSVAGWPKS